MGPSALKSGHGWRPHAGGSTRHPVVAPAGLAAAAAGPAERRNRRRVVSCRAEGAGPSGEPEPRPAEEAPPLEQLESQLRR